MNIEQRQTRRSLVTLTVAEFFVLLALAAFALGMLIARLGEIFQ